jgi:hypothetical protein
MAGVALAGPIVFEIGGLVDDLREPLDRVVAEQCGDERGQGRMPCWSTTPPPWVDVAETAGGSDGSGVCAVAQGTEGRDVRAQKEERNFDLRQES